MLAGILLLLNSLLCFLLLSRGLEREAWIFVNYHKTGYELVTKIQKAFQPCLPPTWRIAKQRIDIRQFVQAALNRPFTVFSAPNMEFPWSDFGPNAKIVHFVRDPVDMILSGYLYHSQDPSPPTETQWLKNTSIGLCDLDPEEWIHIKTIDAYMNGHVTLAPLVDKVRALCKKMISAYRQNSIYATMKHVDLHHENLFAGFRVEAVYSILSKDILRMTANCIFESKAPQGTAHRVFMTELPANQTQAVEGTVAKMMDFLYEAPTAGGTSTSTSTSAAAPPFWQGCLDKQSAVKRCVEEIAIPAQALGRQLNLSSSTSFSSSSSSSHKHAHTGTTTTTGTGAAAVHVTQGFLPSSLRESYKQQLLRDADLGPLLRVLQYVVQETSPLYKTEI
jgi:hypothetical protein